MDRKPRVLHILSDVFFSGAENMVCQIVEMFRGEYDMVYASPDGPIREALEARNVTFYPIAAVTPGELRKAIRAVRPDLVHAHDMKASVAAAAACGKTPLVSHIHNNGFDSRRVNPKTILYHLFSGKMRHIFWVSPSAMKSYRFYSSVADKSSVLRNVIDPKELIKKADSAALQEDYDIIFLGRMSEPKDPLRLVRVLSKVYDGKKDLNAAIVGKGDMEAQVRAAIEESPARGHIHLLGYQENAYGLLRRAKLMIMTSLWEGTPMCALEAMALGVPIVSTPVDGLCDLVSAGVTGFLEDTDEGLAARCLEIIEDPVLREKLSENTRKEAEKILNLETYKQAIRKAYGFEGGKNMKIMQIVPSFEVGGAETMCAGLCRSLAAMGHTVVAVSLATVKTSITRGLEERGVTVRYLDKGPGMDLGCIGRLRRLIRQERPQVLHTHLHALKYAALACSGVPILHTVHNQADQEAVPLDQKIGRFLFRQGKALPVALSPQIRDSIARLYGLPEGQIPVVLNGIDLSRCQVKTDYSLHDPVELIHVGRFYPQKNHEAILEALGILNQRGISARVRLFGEGPRMEEIREKAAALGVACQVVFEGVTDNVFPVLNRADIFVLPSKWEGIPMTVIEAMGTGLPVIASRVGGLGDMVSSGYSGLLIAPTGEALAQAVETLVKDPQLREALGKNALQKAQVFRVEEMARRYEKLYRQEGGSL